MIAVSKGKGDSPAANHVDARNPPKDSNQWYSRWLKCRRRVAQARFDHSHGSRDALKGVQKRGLRKGV